MFIAFLWNEIMHFMFLEALETKVSYIFVVLDFCRFPKLKQFFVFQLFSVFVFKRSKKNLHVFKINLLILNSF
jgi:hypothetical protein